MKVCDEIDVYFTKKDFQKDIYVLRIFFWIFNSNLNIINIYQHELNIYLNIYESIMRASNIQINIQKYAWTFKKNEYLFEYSTFWKFIFEINIHKCLEYSRYLWIFMMFRWVWSPDVTTDFKLLLCSENVASGFKSSNAAKCKLHRLRVSFCILDHNSHSNGTVTHPPTTTPHPFPSLSPHFRCFCCSQHVERGNGRCPPSV